MTGVLLATGAGDDSLDPTRTPIELRLEDSLKSIAAPIRNVSAVMVGVLVGSLAVHALLLATAFVAASAPEKAVSQEIAVDIVQEPPKPPSVVAKPPLKVERAKAAEAPKIQDPPKIQQPPKIQEPAKTQEPPKIQDAKREPAKSEAVKPQPQTSSPQRAAKPPALPKPVEAAKPQGDPQLAALQKELADLRAQREALKSAEAQSSSGSGALAKSLQAIALPSIGDGGEVTGYQEIIFSQLAKAKGDGEWHGPAGTTGVHFEVDADGRLLRADVAASSGNTILDKEALEIVRRAAPFPAPPKDADHSFFANVNFLPPKR